MTKNSALKPEYLNLGLLLLRISTSAFMLTHGWSKLLRLFEDEIKFGDPIGIGAVPSLILVAFAEFFCSIFIMLGLWTRLSSIPLIITMLVAAFISHADDPFKKKEMALLYLCIYLFLLLSGGGKYTLSNLIGKK